MTLTPEQLSAAAGGEPVRIAIEDVEFVLVRSEVFDRLKDEINTDHAELRAMLARSFSDNGWDEPGMDAYDTYQAKP